MGIERWEEVEGGGWDGSEGVNNSWSSFRMWPVLIGLSARVRERVRHEGSQAPRLTGC